MIVVLNKRKLNNYILKSHMLHIYHTMTKPNFVVITHPKSETLANCLSKQDKTFLS